MNVYHVEMRLKNPDDPSEDGTYRYGVREVSADMARRTCVRRAESDGYVVAGFGPTAAVGKGDGWESFQPLCYGKVVA